MIFVRFWQFGPHFPINFSLIKKRVMKNVHRVKLLWHDILGVVIDDLPNVRIFPGSATGSYIILFDRGAP